jgi:hypothetical protein
MKTVHSINSFHKTIVAILIIAMAAMYSPVSARYTDRSDELPGMKSDGEIVASILIPVAIVAAILIPIIVVSKMKKNKRSELSVQSAQKRPEKVDNKVDTSEEGESEEGD